MVAYVEPASDQARHRDHLESLPNDPSTSAFEVTEILARWFGLSLPQFVDAIGGDWRVCDARPPGVDLPAELQWFAASEPAPTSRGIGGDMRCSGPSATRGTSVSCRNYLPVMRVGGFSGRYCWRCQASYLSIIACWPLSLPRRVREGRRRGRPRRDAGRCRRGSPRGRDAGLRWRAGAA